MIAERLTCAEALTGLAREWAELALRCPDATPFQTPAWALPWWRGLGRGRLLVAAVRSGGRLMGLLPVCVRRVGGIRVARLLGSGHSDYLGPLIDPEHREAVVALLADFLRGPGWDVLDLQQLAATLPVGGSSWPHEACQVLRLTAGRSSRSWGKAWRRLQVKGVSAAAVGPGATDAFLEALFRLHGARWRRRGLPGVFAAHRIQAFHREAARELARAGMLRAHLLLRDGAAIAAHYGFHLHGRTFYYAGGFDPAWAPYSPGRVLVGLAVEAARAEGATEFDFLRGDEAYKAGWGARPRLTHRLVVSRCGPLPITALRAGQAVEMWAKRAVRRSR